MVDQIFLYIYFDVQSADFECAVRATVLYLENILVEILGSKNIFIEQTRPFEAQKFKHTSNL